MFEVWTQHGTRELSEEQAQTIAPALKKLLVGAKVQRENRVFDMASMSYQLWILMEPSISKIYEKRPSDQDTLLAYNHLFHKYAPQLVTFKEGENRDSYEMMCGEYEAVKPPLLPTIIMLSEKHANPLAYATALKICSKKDHSLPGQWMKMQHAFSSLNLDPSDPNAWDFWHSLCDCTASDASGQELLASYGDKTCNASSF